MVIFQKPNIQLIVMLAGVVVESLFKSGIANLFGHTLFVAAGFYWCVSEIIFGDSWFRRVLGSIVLIIVIMSAIQLFRSL